MFQSCTTVMFMIGVLLLGSAGFNAKLAYLVCHITQSILLSIHAKPEIRDQTINGMVWRVAGPLKRDLKRRRDAYIWALETTGTTRSPEWLSYWHLANEEIMELIRRKYEAQQEEG